MAYYDMLYTITTNQNNLLQNIFWNSYFPAAQIGVAALEKFLQVSWHQMRLI